MKIKDKHDISDIIENFKIKLKYFLKVSMWVFMVLVIIYGVFKIVKWGEIFNKNYVEYANKKEEIVLPTLIGERNFSYEEKLWMRNFVNKLEKLEIETKEIKTSTSTKQITFYVLEKSIKRDFYLKLNIDKDLEKVWTNFVSIYLSQEIENIKKREEEIEYVDIRFDTKVFYKIKSQETEIKKE